MCPGTAVVGYAVALGEGGIVGHLLAAVELTLLGVDGVDVGGGGAFVRGYWVIGVIEVIRLTAHGFPLLAVNAYTCQTLGAGEDYVAFLVIPCVVLVLLEHGELDGVNHLQVLQTQT